MKKYRIAMYIRLSKEDDVVMPYGRKAESNSITMQRSLLKKYAAENFTDYELLEFCDDGYTGTNLNRPGMQAMLEEARKGGIDCIIVKDLSRFARDYIELGAYLEQIFPFLGIRFISVNDRYDSKDYPGSVADIDVNFKNLLYDLYSKDLSQKIRSSISIRKEKGEYISGNSPFGYEKDPKNRHALLIAEDEAQVVRQIFALTLEGHTTSEIAKLFNKAQVKTPIEFKIAKGRTSRNPKGERFLWSAGTINKILTNEVYIGNVVQKKYMRTEVGGKNHIKPRRDWMITCNHHEPIVEKEVFEEIQKRRTTERAASDKPLHPLTGKLICGCCKRNLAYRRNVLNPYFGCEGRYTNTLESCVKKVNAMFMEQYVLFMIQDKLQKEGELERIRKEHVYQSEQKIKRQKERRKDLFTEIEKLKEENFEIYQRYASGQKEGFQSNESKIKSAEKELAELDESIQELEAIHTRLYDELKRLSVVGEFASFTKEMIDNYIENIVVYDKKNMEINWKQM